MVHIITDTTSCISAKTAEELHIPLIPQVINFGEESFLEGVDISLDEFMKRLKSSINLPKTAAPPVEQFVNVFKRLTPLGEPIICIHPSSEVSGTVRSATVAAQDFPEADIRIIDTRLVSSPIASIVLLAVEWAREGIDADIIVTRVYEMSKRCRVYFLVSTLEYLARGGRIGGASALLGGVLQIKPILRLHEGKVDQYERERTQKRALMRLKEIVSEQCSRDGTGYLTVMEAENRAQALELAEDLGKSVNQMEVPVYPVPPAIITHGGPGILGVGFFVSQ